MWRRDIRGLLVALAIAACGCDRSEARSREAPHELSARDDDADRTAYDRWRRPRVLVDALDLKEGDRVADVGAGHGYLEPYLAAAIGPSGELVATDIDPEALSTLERAAAAAGIAVEIRRVTPADPGLERGAYDLVLLAQVDHLLPDREAYFRRLVPSLSPGGRIAVSGRVDREPPVRRAADAAGLELVAAHHDLPRQFVLIFAPGEVTP